MANTHNHTLTLSTSIDLNHVPPATPPTLTPMAPGNYSSVVNTQAKPTQGSHSNQFFNSQLILASSLSRPCTFHCCPLVSMQTPMQPPDRTRASLVQNTSILECPIRYIFQHLHLTPHLFLIPLQPRQILTLDMCQDRDTYVE